MCCRIVLALVHVVAVIVTANATSVNVSLLQSDIDDYATGCSITLARDLGAPQPLYLTPNNLEFLLPQTTDGVLQIPRNGVVHIHCPKGFEGRFKSHQKPTLPATCESGVKFTAAGVNAKFNEFRCKQTPSPLAKRTGQSCPGGQLAEIGFNVETKFVGLFTLCQNENEARTRWVHYTQNPENAGYQAGREGEFRQGGFNQGMKINSLYTRKVQLLTVAKILGSKELAAKLIHPSNNFYLSRGHMAARSDFIFNNHQSATFYYINAAPQWQTFNGGNWAVVEDQVKAFVAKRNIRTEIYTGTYGVISFPDVKGKQQPIYLSVVGTTKRIPVPKIYYKVIINVKAQEGIVLVGVNNPYATMQEIQKEYMFCTTNVMDKVTYIKWNPKVQNGYLYACDVNEFAEKIGELPQLPPINALLLK